MSWVGLVENGHTPGGMRILEQWPWSWVRLISYVKQVRNVYERVGMDPQPKTATPPRWMFWDSDAADQWFKERRENRPASND
jgi:hypothetical protein